MHRSQSMPGLGKGLNPLRGYLGCPQLLVSEEEVEAERLFYALASSTVTMGAFQLLAKELTRRAPHAGAYLTWLIYCGPQWPKVRKGLVNHVS